MRVLGPFCTAVGRRFEGQTNPSIVRRHAVTFEGSSVVRLKLISLKRLFCSSFRKRPTSPLHMYGWYGE